MLCCRQSGTVDWERKGSDVPFPSRAFFCLPAFLFPSHPFSRVVTNVHERDVGVVRALRWDFARVSAFWELLHYF